MRFDLRKESPDVLNALAAEETSFALSSFLAAVRKERDLARTGLEATIHVDPDDITTTLEYKVCLVGTLNAVLEMPATARELLKKRGDAT